MYSNIKTHKHNYVRHQPLTLRHKAPNTCYSLRNNVLCKVRNKDAKLQDNNAL